MLGCSNVELTVCGGFNAWGTMVVVWCDRIQMIVRCRSSPGSSTLVLPWDSECVGSSHAVERDVFRNQPSVYSASPMRRLGSRVYSTISCQENKSTMM